MMTYQGHIRNLPSRDQAEYFYIRIERQRANCPSDKMPRRLQLEDANESVRGIAAMRAHELDAPTSTSCKSPCLITLSLMFVLRASASFFSSVPWNKVTSLFPGGWLTPLRLLRFEPFEPVFEPPFEVELLDPWLVPAPDILVKRVY